MTTRLIFPVVGVIRKSGLPLKIGFDLLDARHGTIIDSMEARRKWDGVLWQVTVARPHRPRSTGEQSQNHHINGHVHQIAAETGAGFDTVKNALKREAMSAGYPGEDFRGNRWPISETNASVEDAIVLIETCHRIAAELNITLREGIEDEETNE